MKLDPVNTFAKDPLKLLRLNKTNFNAPKLMGLNLVQGTSRLQIPVQCTLNYGHLNAVET